MTAPRPLPPPRTPELLLESLGAASGFREALVGDLAEEFARRAAGDEAAARRWYYREAARAAPHLLRDWARRARAGDVRYLAGVVVTSYLFTAMIGVVVACVVVGLAYVAASAIGVTLRAPARPWAHPVVLLGVLTVGIPAAATGGYVAAWLGRRAPLVSALALGVAWSSLGFVMLTLAGGLPLWYRLGVPLVVIVGTALGGARRVCTEGALARSA